MQAARRGLGWMELQVKSPLHAAPSLIWVVMRVLLWAFQQQARARSDFRLSHLASVVMLQAAPEALAQMEALAQVRFARPVAVTVAPPVH